MSPSAMVPLIQDCSFQLYDRDKSDPLWGDTRFPLNVEYLQLVVPKLDQEHHLSALMFLQVAKIKTFLGDKWDKWEEWGS